MHTHQRLRYPIGWERIARELKQSVGNCCQECGTPATVRTLTCAHVYPDSHDPSAEVVCVQILCLHCHLRFDAAWAAATRRRYERRYQMAFATHWARRREPDATAEDRAELAAAWPGHAYLETLDDGIDWFPEGAQ